MNITTVIRMALTGALLYGVYTETGLWTTVAIGLANIAIELLIFKVDERKS